MDSTLSDEEIAEAARRRASASRARVLRRVPFTGGGGGSRFARLVLEIDGVARPAILKEVAPDRYHATLERRFYEEVAPGMPLRIPALYASGPLPDSEGWIAMEPLPEPAGRGFTAERFLALARDLGRAHAALLGAAPPWLPRPFGRDARASLAHVPHGVAALRERMRRTPALRFLASDEALDAAVALARDPEPIVRACARAPETVIHRDLHHHNVSFGRDGAVVFDWESVSAGPAVFDLALLHVYQQDRVLPFPGVRLFAWRRPLVAWPALLAAYLAALHAHAPSVDVPAVAAAAPAAFAWEATHRLGWVDPLLAELTPGAAALARVPLLGAVEGVRTGPVMLRVWRALFAGLPGWARSLGA